MNIPDARSWKWSAYTLASSACDHAVAWKCTVSTYPDTLKVPHATYNSILDSVADKRSNCSSLYLALTYQYMSFPIQMHRVIHLFARSSLPKVIMLMNSIASDATVTSLGEVWTASSNRCAESRNASDSSDASGKICPNEHCETSTSESRLLAIESVPYTCPEED